MVTVLEDIKNLLELDDTTEYDTQLMRIANSGVAKLINMGVPLTLLKDDTTAESWTELSDVDAQEVRDWLSWYALLRFDRRIERAAYLNTSEIMDEIAAGLKIRYDRKAKHENR